jgi:ComF family protein
MAYGSYEGGLRDLIHLLKYEQVRPAATVLGRMLAEVLIELAPQAKSNRHVVIPVPLHQSKYRQRGFNQLELIVRAALKFPELAHLELSTSTLFRQRATESQTGLTRSQRLLNVKGAFKATRPGEITGRSILLVDDVFTTGTTLSECARVLRRAGAAEVRIATVARVLRREGAYMLPIDEGEDVEPGAPLARVAKA